MNARRFLILSATAAAGLAVAAPASASVVAGTTAWTVRGARSLGAMPARPMTITLALAPRHAVALQRLATATHAPLSPAAFLRRYAPTAADVRIAERWAHSSGLKVSSVSADRLLVRLSGSSTHIASALHTSFGLFSSPATGRYFQITRAARLPASLSGKVQAILGLSSLASFRMPHPRLRTASALGTTLAQAGTAGTSAGSLNYPADYKPQDFWSMYDAPSSQTGSRQQLAIITEGDLSSPKQDLATFEKTYGLPSVTWNQIDVGTQTSDTSGDDEWDLDSQYSTGFAPGVSQLDVYVGPSLANQDIIDTIDRFVTDDISRQGSFSAGECEILADAGGLLTSLDTILQEADAHGQSMFFSSGDTGAFCPAVIGVNGVPAGLPNVNYPASSPYGIGVGGTSVLSPSGPTEIAWYAGGGGESLLEPVPAFQSSTTLGGVAPLLTRGVPDVSLDADPESGYDVVVGGTVQVIGGTSASAPAWQGIWARAQGAHSGGLGFAGPVLYSTVPAAAFHDITLGLNGYPALPGYDLATGLGTPDIAALVAGA